MQLKMFKPILHFGYVKSTLTVTLIQFIVIPVIDSPSGKGGFCEPVELPLLRRLPSLFTDRLDLSFLCIFCDTGVDGCFLGCSVVAVAMAVVVPGLPVAPMPILAPQEHVHVVPGGPPTVGWIPLTLLSGAVLL